MKIVTSTYGAWVTIRQCRGQAFTLVEVVIVIAIIGILAAIVIPRIITIRSEAYIAQRDVIVGSVRAGILTVASQNQVAGGVGTFPPNVEAPWNTITGGAVSVGSACVAATPCYELVIPGGYTDANWTQTTGTKYDFTAPVGGGSQQYKYDSSNGTFKPQ